MTNLSFLAEEPGDGVTEALTLSVGGDRRLTGYHYDPLAALEARGRRIVGAPAAAGAGLATLGGRPRVGAEDAKMPLEEYRRKRRFGVTPEPEGKTPAPRRSKKLAYVVQKHRATALHYDFRLEWNGVMLSWAVPKGPSLDPKVKRLAMPTEDHPIEYNKFEGIIPEGEYGAGTVMIWDRGYWLPELPDVDAALKKGELKFRLEGEKLHGSWVLVRTGRRGEGRPSWLLIKHRDEFATEKDIAEEEPRSVVSKRLLVEIARDEGGNLTKAADGDPPALLRKMLENPKLIRPAKKSGKKSVWHSNRRKGAS